MTFLTSFSNSNSNYDFFILHHQETPPFVPVIKDETDTSNFEEDEDNENNPLDVAPMKKSKGFQGNELPFIGYTFNRNFQYVSSQPNVCFFSFF